PTALPSSRLQLLPARPGRSGPFLSLTNCEGFRLRRGVRPNSNRHVGTVRTRSRAHMFVVDQCPPKARYEPTGFRDPRWVIARRGIPRRRDLLRSPQVEGSSMFLPHPPLLESRLLAQP